MYIAIIKKPLLMAGSMLILALFCQSCCSLPVIPTTVSQRGPIDDETLSFLQVGITTKEDILLSLGNPTYCFQDEESFEYCWDILYGMWFIGGGGYAGFMGPIGRKYCLALEFDERGLLTKNEVKRNVYLWEKQITPNCR